jgi:DNA-binding CsgD family transcriptional regulator
MLSGNGRHERTLELLDLLAAGHPPAFATDSRDRIVFCNSGAAQILGRRADELLGQRCHEAIAGRDVFGNRFCYANCPVRASVRAQEGLSGFDMEVATNGSGMRSVSVTIIRIPSVRPDLFTLVHLLHPIAPASRLAWLHAHMAGAFAAADDAAGPARLERAASEAPPPLTPREREILRHIAAGLQNKEVAARLQLSTATVRNHVHHILDKLQVHSKLEAVSLAYQRGWVPAGCPGPADPASRAGASAAAAERDA